MNQICFINNKETRHIRKCENHFFNGSEYHGLGMHKTCFTCKHTFFFNSAEELQVEKERRNIIINSIK